MEFSVRTPDEDEHVLRRRGKSRHFTERLVPQGLIVTTDFAETVEAEEDAPQHLRGPKCGINGRLRERGWLIVL